MLATEDALHRKSERRESTAGNSIGIDQHWLPPMRATFGLVTVQLHVIATKSELSVIPRCSTNDEFYIKSLAKIMCFLSREASAKMGAKLALTRPTSAIICESH